MKSLIFWAICTLALAACTTAPVSDSSGQEEGTLPEPDLQVESSSEKAPPAAAATPTPRLLLEDFGPAPELTNEVWLNNSGPLRLEDLRGSVVLLDMWTFGCINCKNVIPSLREWHHEYGPEGLVVIGNHYPEFGYEEDLDNLKEAIVRLDVPYAVAQDNDGATWRAYGNRYWPTLYLIDKKGHIRYRHIGEGAYELTEKAIQTLLAEEIQ